MGKRNGKINARDTLDAIAGATQMNHISILSASWKYTRLLKQYKELQGGAKVLAFRVNAKGKDVPMRDEPLVKADSRQAEKRLDNTHGDSNSNIENGRHEGHTVSPDPPLNYSSTFICPIWGNSPRAAEFSRKNKNGTFDNGPQAKKWDAKTVLALIAFYALATYCALKVIGVL